MSGRGSGSCCCQNWAKLEWRLIFVLPRLGFLRVCHCDASGMLCWYGTMGSPRTTPTVGVTLGIRQNWQDQVLEPEGIPTGLEVKRGRYLPPPSKNRSGRSELGRRIPGVHEAHGAAPDVEPAEVQSSMASGRWGPRMVSLPRRTVGTGGKLAMSDSSTSRASCSHVGVGLRPPPRCAAAAAVLCASPSLQ